MYHEEERQFILDKVVKFISGNNEFEGLLQIGSGANGFSDIYSDIDIMAGCFSANAVYSASDKLFDFFSSLNTCHIQKRSWTNTALGMSAYFDNGLSIDLSYMPTNELPIRTPEYKVLFSKSQQFNNRIETCARLLKEQSGGHGVDNSIHYHFMNELRYAEIALHRRELVFADIALSRARQLLLTIETAHEKKKLHQFKAYNTLNADFLHRLQATYSKAQSKEEMLTAKNNLLTLYLETVEKCDFLNFNYNLLKLINCFDAL